MSIAVPLYGFGSGGGNSLYYSVVCSTTEPAKKEGRIWIKSAVPMTQFEVGNTWSSAKVGVVVAGGTPGGANPTSTNKILDLINTKVAGIPNRLKLTPGSCRQVQGSAGNWVSVDAYVCHENTWVQFAASRITPEFTYTGDYEVADDSDNPISDFASWTGNWKIRFLTSGTLTFTSLNGAEGGIDVFLVGGGGGACGTNSNAGGGGGGYTKTVRAVQALVGVAYQIVVGAGGQPTKGGGTSSAFNESAEGGKSHSTTTVNGGDGGSGGGARGDGNLGVGGRGGSDGSDGFRGAGNDATVGQGQKTTTREFGESANKLYSGGGAGGSTGGAAAVAGGAGGGGNGGADDGVDTAATPGETNTGGGGGGGYKPAAGGSGIVIIRNAREAA